MSSNIRSKLETIVSLVIAVITALALFVYSREESGEPALQKLTYMHLKKNISDDKIVLCDDNLEGLDPYIRPGSGGILENTPINKRQGDKIPDYIIADRQNTDDFHLVIEVESKDGLTKDHTQEQMKDFCEKYDRTCLVTLNEAEAISRALDIRKTINHKFGVETPTTVDNQL